MDPVVVAVASSLPEPCWSTGELLAAAGRRFSPQLVTMLGSLGIERRHSVLSNYPHVLFEDAAPRLDIKASALAAQAASECLEKSGARPEQIGLVLGVTTSPGRLLPSLACDLFALLPWVPRDAASLSITYMGCSAIAKVAETARWYLTCHPGRLVLACFMEAITPLAPVLPGRYAHFTEVPAQLQQQTVNAVTGFLFADASVAMLLAAAGPGPVLGPVTQLTNERADDAELGTVPDGGSDVPVVHGRRLYTMRPEVGPRGAFYARATVDALLAGSKCALPAAGEAAFLLLHTGSARILDSLCDQFGVPRDSEPVASSYRVLRHYGNTGGCSVPLMLADPVRRSAGEGLIVAFGLSFSSGALTVTIPPGGWHPDQPGT